LPLSFNLSVCSSKPDTKDPRTLLFLLFLIHLSWSVCVIVLLLTSFASEHVRRGAYGGPTICFLCLNLAISLEWKFPGLSQTLYTRKREMLRMGRCG
jgi:hypothetical protein